ncbi:MAG: hypothetical protein IKU52_03820 [Clostridia bacterium]|nr:hypothetical protein [Clostridia bacterium]
MKIKSVILMTVLAVSLFLVTGITVAAQQDEVKESVSANGVIITVSGLNDTRDFYISKGIHRVFKC